LEIYVRNLLIYTAKNLSLEKKYLPFPKISKDTAVGIKLKKF
jgi:hypothetical protein